MSLRIGGPKGPTLGPQHNATARDGTPRSVINVPIRGTGPTRALTSEALAKLASISSAMTDQEVAALLGVGTATLYRWREMYPEYEEALARWSEQCHDRVERALYHRAIGYVAPSVKIFMHEGEPVIVPYMEHYPPDVAACIFWLKNRRGNDWHDRQELTGADGAKLFDSDNPDGMLELAKRIALVLQEAKRKLAAKAIRDEYA